MRYLKLFEELTSIQLDLQEYFYDIMDSYDVYICNPYKINNSQILEVIIFGIPNPKTGKEVSSMTWKNSIFTTSYFNRSDLTSSQIIDSIEDGSIRELTKILWYEMKSEKSHSTKINNSFLIRRINSMGKFILKDYCVSGMIEGQKGFNLSLEFKIIE